MKTAVLFCVFIGLIGIALSANTPAPTQAPTKAPTVNPNLGVLRLSSIIFDQAPATMIHKNYPNNYWVITNWNDNPLLGDAGTANGGKGFNNSDFELPLFVLGNQPTMNPNNYTIINGEKGLAGTLCSKANNFKNCATINTTDRSPIYAYKGRSPLGQITSPLTFYQFFHQCTETYPVAYNLTLTETAVGSNNYYYKESLFYPVDGRGWNDRGFSNYDNLYHNFGYCLALHTRFAYSGGEVFRFSGDDDVYVFLDNRLMIDLGGVHTELSAIINLDDVGLTKGENYRFDFFYCERHTIVSEIEISTTIQFYCAYYDWCDVCEGNGQSCCTAGVCDDNDPCTVDQCAILIPPTTTGGCVHTALNCTAVDKCHTVQCISTQGGCVTSTISCEDNNACTTDTCVPATGCSHTTISCDKGDACFTDSCDPSSGCKHVAKPPCNDSNLCTTDSCSAQTGCIFSTIPCDPINACNTAACTPTGGCVQTAITCKAPNKCQDASCDPVVGCQYPTISCTGTNKCLIYSCDKDLGCVTKNVTCDDGLKCTVDSCDPNNGCQYKPVSCVGNACFSSACDPSSGFCTQTPLGCDDNNLCTSDVCYNATGCQHVTLPCDDGNACTKDVCTPLGGCVSTSITCNDGDYCTDDTCDVKAGCLFTRKVCNDNNACTLDACVNKSIADGGGCRYTNNSASCNNGNKCTTPSCDPNSGCVYNPINCVDKDKCTTDLCNVSIGCVNNKVANCSYCADKDCDAEKGNTDMCNPWVCVQADGSCVRDGSAKVNCDDSNDCTVDNCVTTTGLCTHSTLNCTTTDKCLIPYCEAVGGCKTRAKVCDDGNPCTVDSCAVNGSCVFTPKFASGVCLPCANDTCTYTNNCNPQICDPNTKKCVPGTPVTCDDQNACTQDKCVTTATGTNCSYTDTVCSKGDSCTPGTCDPVKGCTANNITCTDNNLCTIDTCVPTSTGQPCVFTPIQCLFNDLCNPQSCDAKTGLCVSTAINCDDGNPCTDDSCLNGTCVHVLNCVTENGCFPKTCDPVSGACSSSSFNCSGGNACAIDACVDVNGTATCQHTPMDCPGTVCDPQICVDGACVGVPPPPCDDHNPCTIDTQSCNSTDGFVCSSVDNSTALCDDGDSCTNDFCDSTMSAATGTEACWHTNVTCAAPTACQTFGVCRPVNGCVYDEIDCVVALNITDFCTVPICDEAVGCLPVSRACVVDDNTCYQGVCDSKAGTCLKVQRPNWANVKRSDGQTCLLFYSVAAKAATIAAGAIAGIVIGAVVVAALIGFGGKKGYDLWMANRAGPAGAVNTNPLYAQAGGQGSNPLYA